MQCGSDAEIARSEEIRRFVRSAAHRRIHECRVARGNLTPGLPQIPA